VRGGSGGEVWIKGKRENDTGGGEEG